MNLNSIGFIQVKKIILLSLAKQQSFFKFKFAAQTYLQGNLDKKKR